MSGRVTYNPVTGRCQWSQYSTSPGRALYKGYPDIIVHVPGVQVRGWVPNGYYYRRQWFVLPELQVPWRLPRQYIGQSYYDTAPNWWGPDYTIPGSGGGSLNYVGALVRYNLFRGTNAGVDGWILRIYADEAGGSGGWAGVLELWRAGSEQKGAYEYMASNYDSADFSFEGPYTVTYA